MSTFFGIKLLEVDYTYIAYLLQARSFLVPWWVKARWCRVLSYVVDIRLVVSHIFREGSVVADALAAPGMEEGVWLSASPSILSPVNYDF